MPRIFIFATIVWLAGFDIAHAQMTPAGTSDLTPGAAPGTAPGTIPGTTAPAATGAAAVSGIMKEARTPCPTSGTSSGGMVTAIPCTPDPLNLPTATLSPSGATAGAALASTGGLGAFSSFGASSSSFGSSIGPVSSPISAQTLNPERALQLPGEAPNTATQTPIAATPDQGSTASRSGVPSAALCSAAMPSAGGTTNPVNLFAGVSVNGC
jgi:hypothetical protein